MICLGKKSFVVGIYQRMQHRFFVFEMMVDSAFAEVFELVENILNRGALIPLLREQLFRGVKDSLSRHLRVRIARHMPLLQ